QAMKYLEIVEVDLVNAHALGGTKMIEAAKEGLLSGHSNPHTKLIAVTLLTSHDEQSINEELRIEGSIAHNTVHYDQRANKHGADGVVCSVHEATPRRESSGINFLT